MSKWKIYYKLGGWFIWFGTYLLDKIGFTVDVKIRLL